MTTDLLRAENLTLNYGGDNIVSDLEVTLPPGKITSIIGPPQWLW